MNRNLSNCEKARKKDGTPCSRCNFKRRKLISTEEAHFSDGGVQFLCNRLILVLKTKTTAKRKRVFIQKRLCFTVCSGSTSGPPYKKSLLHTSSLQTVEGVVSTMVYLFKTFLNGGNVPKMY